MVSDIQRRRVVQRSELWAEVYDAPVTSQPAWENPSSMDDVIDSLAHWPDDYKVRAKAVLAKHSIFSRNDWDRANHTELPVGLVVAVNKYYEKADVAAALQCAPEPLSAANVERLRMIRHDLDAFATLPRADIEQLLHIDDAVWVALLAHRFTPLGVQLFKNSIRRSWCV